MSKSINTAETKLMIIENFIDYYCYSNYEEKEMMMQIALDYVNQDHVDEIGQTLGIEHPIDYTYSTIKVKSMDSEPFDPNF